MKIITRRHLFFLFSFVSILLIPPATRKQQKQNLLGEIIEGQHSCLAEGKYQRWMTVFPFLLRATFRNFVFLHAGQEYLISLLWGGNQHANRNLNHTSACLCVCVSVCVCVCVCACVCVHIFIFISIRRNKVLIQPNQQLFIPCFGFALALHHVHT